MHLYKNTLGVTWDVWSVLGRLCASLYENLGRHLHVFVHLCENLEHLLERLRSFWVISRLYVKTLGCLGVLGHLFASLYEYFGRHLHVFVHLCENLEHLFWVFGRLGVSFCVFIRILWASLGMFGASWGVLGILEHLGVSLRAFLCVFLFGASLNHP